MEEFEDELLASFKLNELKATLEEVRSKISKNDIDLYEETFKYENLPEKDVIGVKPPSILALRNTDKAQLIENNTELSTSREWDKIKEKGESLRQRMDKAKLYDDYNKGFEFEDNAIIEYDKDISLAVSDATNVDLFDSVKFKDSEKTFDEPINSISSSPEKFSAVTQKDEIPMFQLYLFIERASKLLRADGSYPDFFISYKIFLNKEKFQTKIYQNYSENTSINYKMLFPLAVNDDSLEKLSSGIIPLEIWDKNNSQDNLLGLVKLPLSLLGTALSANLETFTKTVYPFVAIDEYKPINSLKTGKDIGYLKVCLAVGTPSQISRLDLTQSTDNKFDDFPRVTGAFKELNYENKAEKIENHEQCAIDSIDDIALFLNQGNLKNTIVDTIDMKEMKAFNDISFNEEMENNKTESLKNYEESANFEKVESKKIDTTRWDECKFDNFQEKVCNIKQGTQKIEKIQDLQISKISHISINQKKEKKPKNELIQNLKNALKSSHINLEEELKITDKYSLGFLHTLSFIDFFEKLQLEIPTEDIQDFLAFVVKAHPSTSTHRRVLFTDIYKALDIKESANIKHNFNEKVMNTPSCPKVRSSLYKKVFVKCDKNAESYRIDDNLSKANSSSNHSNSFLTEASFEKSATIEPIKEINTLREEKIQEKIEENYKVSEKSLEEEDFSMIYQKHLENMKTLENLTQNFRSWRDEQNESSQSKQDSLTNYRTNSLIDDLLFSSKPIIDSLENINLNQFEKRSKERKTTDFY